MSKKVLRLVKRVDPKSVHNPPPAVALERKESEMSEYKDRVPTYVLHEIEKGVFEYPFPLSEESQIKLLRLLTRRNSGIITRSELKEILFPKRTIN